MHFQIKELSNFHEKKRKKKFSLCKLVNLIRVKLKSTLFFRTSAITRARRGREREKGRDEDRDEAEEGLNE